MGVLGQLGKRRVNDGFTLVELLIVIAIIGVLSALATVNYIAVRQRARDGQRKADLLVIASAVEQYRGDAGNYPTLSGSFSLAPCNQPFTSSDNSITYLKKIPCDPLNSSQTFNTGNYVYLNSTGSDYSLIACLENTSDKSGVSVSQLPSGVPNSSSCSSGNFYIVTDGNPVSSSTGGSSPTSTPVPTDTPTPSFTPTPTNIPTPTPTKIPTPTYTLTPTPSTCLSPSISGTVYIDSNGSHNPSGQKGYQGASVNIVQGSFGHVPLTDNNGFYSVCGLSSNYVTTVTLVVPTGYTATTQNPVTFSPPPFTGNNTVNFGIH